MGPGACLVGEGGKAKAKASDGTGKGERLSVEKRCFREAGGIITVDGDDILDQGPIGGEKDLTLK